MISNLTPEHEKVQELLNNSLLSDEELVETAEMIFNFKMNINGIKNLLWQLCRKQAKQILSYPDLFIRIPGVVYKYIPISDVLKELEALPHDRDITNLNDNPDISGGRSSFVK